MTDAELLTLALRLPTGSPGAATKRVFVPGRAGIGSPDPGMIVPEDDPQKLASALATLRTQTQGGARDNPFWGSVVGDTPGGAQSALLNLRAQNIQIEQEAARRAEAARQAELNRQLQREIQAQANQQRAAEFARATQQDTVAQQMKQAELELRRMLGLGELQTRADATGTRYRPADTRLIDALQPYGRQLAESESSNQAELANLMSLLQSNARNSGRERNLLVSFDRSGLPVYEDPSQDVNVPNLYDAEDAAYRLPDTVATSANLPSTDLRALLNKAWAQQEQLALGRKNFENDMKMAMAVRNDRQPIPPDAASQQVMSAVMQALATPPQQQTSVQTAAQRLLAERGYLVPTGQPNGRPAAGAAPAPPRWVLRNGQVVRQ